MLLSHRQRLWQLSCIAAKYRLDSYLPETDEFQSIKRLIRLHPKSLGKKPQPLGLKHAIEAMGTLFVKLGQLLSTRSDLLPSEVIAELALLQDNVTPFASELAIAEIERAFGLLISELFAHFEPTPLAAASIAQVHTAKLLDGQAVVVKVVRPNISGQIEQDFALLASFADYVSARVEMARAVNLPEIVADYRQIMLNELDLTLEAANSAKMRANFLGSPLIYVPKVYKVSKTVLVSERIYGVPISQIATLDALNYDRATLAKQGLTIFFTQVFYHNFFHADMHAGNIFVETMPDGSPVANPRYVGLDCAIMGELSPFDQLTVARMLLAVMNNNFVALVEIMLQAGWVPPSVDQYALMRDLTRTVSPMIAKPMSELDFAGVLYAILAIARRHHMTIPPQLVLLLKTLVHVEGLGRDLYPELDIWQLAKPILSRWLSSRLDPIKHWQDITQKLPETLLASSELPRLAFAGVQSLALMGGRQEALLRQLALVRQDMLNSRRYDWLALMGLLLCGFVGWGLVLVTAQGWLAVPFVLLGLLVLVWRLTV